MDACCAVDKELEKLFGRYKSFQENSSKLTDLIQHVESIKNGLCEGKVHFTLQFAQLERIDRKAPCGFYFSNEMQVSISEIKALIWLYHIRVSSIYL